MLAAAGFENARSAARALVERFGVEAPGHVLVEGFAARLGVRLSVAVLSGTTAQLVMPRGRQPEILLSDRVVDPAVRRFAIAHELGHYVLRHPSASIAEMHAPTPHTHDPTGAYACCFEGEANAFAVELLLPERLVRPMCEVTWASLDPALRLAYTFGVTVTTSAIRFADLTNAPCAVVRSEGGMVRWAASNMAFPGRVANGKTVDARALASEYFKTGTLPSGMRQVPAAAWLDVPAEMPLMEHSIASHERGTVLTLLWAPPTALAWPRSGSHGSPRRRAAYVARADAEARAARAPNE